MILRYSDIGDGDPIVLLHSRPADRTQWEPLAGLFAAAGYRVLCPDLPGFGESAAPTTGPSAPWDDVCETLDELGIDRAFLVGNSFGAQTALQVAAAHPERVNGLCVMGYRRHDQPPTDRLQQAWDEEASALEHNDLDAAVEAGVRAWLSPTARPSEKQTLRRALRNNLNRRQEPQTDQQVPDPLNSAGWAQQVGMPVRILHGAEDMPDFLQGAETLRDALDAPEVTIVPEAAHLIPLDQPVAVATVALQMLREKPTSSPA